MERFLFDYIYDGPQRIVINELIASDEQTAIEFMDRHFLELHAEREREITSVRLRNLEDQQILNCEIFSDVY